MWQKASAYLQPPPVISTLNAFDDGEIRLGRALPYRFGLLVFWALVTRVGRRQVGKFHNDIALTGVPLHAFVGSAAHQKFRAKFLECGSRRSQISRVVLRIVNCHPNHPIPFCHAVPLRKWS